MVSRVVAIIQARLGSSRLPGKTLAEIGGRPMLAHVLERVAAVPGVDDVVVATTVNPLDDHLVTFVKGLDLACVRGSEDDVLDRFHTALARHPADVIVRVTPDCPLLDPAVTGLVLAEYLRREGRVDYVSNVHPPTYPDGLDTEVFSRAALETAWREAHLASDREHVTTYVWRQPNRFRLANVGHSEDLSALRWTVDTAADLEFVRRVYDWLAPTGASYFGMAEVLELLRRRPELQALNAGLRRNEGLERSWAAERGAGR